MVFTCTNYSIYAIYRVILFLCLDTLLWQRCVPVINILLKYILDNYLYPSNNIKTLLIILLFIIIVGCSIVFRGEILRLLRLLIFLKALSLFQTLSPTFTLLASTRLGDKINMLLIILLMYIFTIIYLVCDFSSNKGRRKNQILMIAHLILLHLFWLTLCYYYTFILRFPFCQFFLIIGWGYQTERVSARLASMFYTISSSMPLLVFLYYRLIFNKIFFFSQLSLILNIHFCSSIIRISMIFAFLVKIPIFFRTCLTT